MTNKSELYSAKSVKNDMMHISKCKNEMCPLKEYLRQI